MVPTMRNLGHLIVSSIAAAGCAHQSPATNTQTTAATANVMPNSNAPHADHKHHAGHGAGVHGDHRHGHTGAGMTHRFDDAQKWSQVFDDPARDAWQKPDEVVAKMEIAANMSVADVGAGTGYFMERLAKAVGANGRVTMTDIEPAMVAHMTDRATRGKLAWVQAALASATGPGLAANTMDRVLIVDVWHHIADRVAYASSLAKSLKPGGKVYIVDFTMETPMGPPREHRLAPQAIINDFTSAGLVANVIEESLPNQYIVVATKP